MLSPPRTGHNFFLQTKVIANSFRFYNLAIYVIGNGAKNRFEFLLKDIPQIVLSGVEKYCKAKLPKCDLTDFGYMKCLINIVFNVPRTKSKLILCFHDTVALIDMLLLGLWVSHRSLSNNNVTTWSLKENRRGGSRSRVKDSS